MNKRSLAILLSAVVFSSFAWSVSAQSTETDLIAPTTIQDLGVLEEDGDSAILRWTAPADDWVSSTIGSAAEYDLRYSTSVMPTNENFLDLPRIPVLLTPAPAGQVETYPISLPEGVYFFGIRAIDEAGNVSNNVSNMAVVKIIPGDIRVILSDDMENGSNGWTATGLWHQETKRSWSPNTSWAYNTGAPYYHYMTGGRNTGSLTSPSFSLVGTGQPQLRFAHWHWDDGVNDLKYIEIGSNGVFTRIWQFGGFSNWRKLTANLWQYKGHENVQVRFVFDSVNDSFNMYEGWYVDHVEVVDLLPNEGPIADAGGPYSGFVGSPVSFTGSATDPNNDPLTYLWSFGDGSTSSDAMASHAYSAPGDYTVTLEVSDGSFTSADTATVHIWAPPAAEAGEDQIGFRNQAFTFSGSGSADADGDIVKYEWNFGDGTTFTGMTASHQYWNEGTYTVTLKVTDATGLTSTDSLSVQVNSDSVQITKATWSRSADQLVVEAVSTSNGKAALSVANWGMMAYDASRNLYVLVKNNVTKRPAGVSVNSTAGGSASASVTQIK